jgi:hypothetical protein
MNLQNKLLFVLRKIRGMFYLISKSVSLLVNLILLTFVYFIGVGLTSFFVKIFRDHFFDIDILKNESYWEKLNLDRESFRDYYRQF